MPRRYSLDTDETVAILTQSASSRLLEDFRDRPNKQEQFLRRLLDALDSPVPENYVEKAFRGARHLRQFRAGGELRGYCLFENTPPGYNFFIFVWITEHEYDQHEISRFDSQAGDWAEEVRQLGSESATADFANEYDAFDTEKVLTVMDRLDLDTPPDAAD